jgi:hypothetical protein
MEHAGGTSLAPGTGHTAEASELETQDAPHKEGRGNREGHGLGKGEMEPDFFIGYLHSFILAFQMKECKSI